MSSEQALKLAWNSFCDQLASQMRAAGEFAIDATPDIDEQHEGLRVLIRDVRYAMEREIEEQDIELPVFTQTTRDTHHMLVDAADYGIFDAKITGLHEYVIRGQVGQAEELTFMVMGSRREANSPSDASLGTPIFAALSGKNVARPRAMTGYLDLRDLEVDRNGGFTISVTRQAPPAGNWLRMDENSDRVIVRNIFSGPFLTHRRQWPAKLWIEQVDRAPASSSLRDELLEGLDSILAGAGSISMSRWAMSNRIAQLGPCAFSSDDSWWKRTGSNPSSRFQEAYWELGTNQAMVIQLDREPESRFWSLGLANMWMEALDFRFQPTNINSGSAVRRDDGGIVILVSAQDPGAANWLNTLGHSRGLMLWRWNEPAEPLAVPHCTVMDFTDLADHPALRKN